MSISQIKSTSKSLKIVFTVLSAIYITSTNASNNLLPQNNFNEQSNTISEQPDLNMESDEDDAFHPLKMHFLTWEEIEDFDFSDKPLEDFYEFFNTIITEDIEIPEFSYEEKNIIKYINASISKYKVSDNSLLFYESSNMDNIINEKKQLIDESFFQIYANIIKTNEQFKLMMLHKKINTTCNLEHKKLFCAGGRNVHKTRDPQKILKKVEEHHNKRVIESDNNRKEMLQYMSSKIEENLKIKNILIENSIFHLVKNNIFFEARRLMTIEKLYKKVFDYIKERRQDNSYLYNRAVSACNRLLEIPLCLAAEKGRVAIMEFLISKGVNPQGKRCTFIPSDDYERMEATLSPYEHAMETYQDMISGLVYNDKTHIETYIDINKVGALLNKHNATSITSNKMKKLENEILKLESDVEILSKLLSGELKLLKHNRISKKKLEKLLKTKLKLLKHNHISREELDKLSKSKQQLKICYIKHSKIIQEQLSNMLENTPVIYPSGLSLDILNAVWNYSLTEEQIKVLQSLDCRSPEYMRQHTHL